MGREEEVTRPEKLIAKVVEDDIAIGVYSGMVKSLQDDSERENRFTQKELREYGFKAEGKGTKRETKVGQLRWKKASLRIRWLIDAGLIEEDKEEGHHPVYSVKGLLGLRAKVREELEKRFGPSFMDWLLNKMGKKHYFDSDEDDWDEGIQVFGLRTDYPLEIGLIVSEANKKNIQETFWDDDRRRNLIERAMIRKGTVDPDEMGLSEIFEKLGVENLCELRDLLLGYKVIHETQEDDIGVIFPVLTAKNLMILDRLYPDGWLLTISSERFSSEFQRRYRGDIPVKSEKGTKNLNDLREDDEKLRGVREERYNIALVRKALKRGTTYDSQLATVLKWRGLQSKEECRKFITDLKDRGSIIDDGKKWKWVKED